MTIPKKKTVKKKTVKELEEELEKVKSSAVSQACRISQEKLAKEHFQDKAKKTAEELKKAKSEVRLAREKISELSPFMKLEELKKRLDKLKEWEGSVVVGNINYEFSVDDDATLELEIDDVKKGTYLLANLPEEAKALARIANEAENIKMELEEIREALKAVAETVEPLHELLSKPKEQEKEPEVEIGKVQSQ